MEAIEQLILSTVFNNLDQLSNVFQSNNISRGRIKTINEYRNYRIFKLFVYISLRYILSNNLVLSIRLCPSLIKINPMAIYKQYLGTANSI